MFFQCGASPTHLKAGIKGFYHTSEDEKENSEGKRTYCRVCCHSVICCSKNKPKTHCVSKPLMLHAHLANKVLELDAEDGALDKVSGIFESVFHGLSMRAVVDPQTPPEEGSACAELITSLRELDNLHLAE